MNPIVDTPGEGTSESVTSQCKKRKGRGRGKCNFMKQLVKGEKFQVLVDGNQLVEKSGLQFSTWVGTLARDPQLLPIDRPSWKVVEKEAKEQVWEYIQDKVDIDDKMERSERNKRNRSCQKLVHTAGTKSFARIRHEEHLKRPMEKPPTRSEIFLLTHSYKDGTPVNEEAAEKISEMKDRLSEEGLEDTTSRDDVYSKVIRKEKSGRVRGVGFGPTPTNRWGSSSSRCGPPSSVIISMNDKIHHLKELLKQRDIEMAEQQKQKDE